MVKQWGKYTNSGNDRVITYPIAFSELYYANVISPDNCETFVYGIGSTNINTDFVMGIMMIAGTERRRQGCSL